jgi:hypothetical protein
MLFFIAIDILNAFFKDLSNRLEIDINLSLKWSQHLSNRVTDFLLLDLVDLDRWIYLAYFKHLLLAVTQLFSKNLSYCVHFILCCLEFIDLSLLMGLLYLEGISQLEHLVPLIILIFFDYGFESVNLIEGLFAEFVHFGFDNFEMVFGFFFKSRRFLYFTLYIRRST